MEKQQGKLTAAAKHDAYSHPQLDDQQSVAMKQKQIENSKKQIAANKEVVNDLKKKLALLGGTDDKGDFFEEKLFFEELQKNRLLESELKSLRKQNANTKIMLQRNEFEEDQDSKLKTLSDDLKAWKTKVT